MPSDYVTVDWDDELDEDSFKSKLDERLHALPPSLRPISCYYRKSSSGGRWHVKLLYPRNLSREERFRARGDMFDDGRRLAWDRARVMGAGVVDYSRGVLYDVKGYQDFESGVLSYHEAGPWRRFKYGEVKKGEGPKMETGDIP